MKYKIKLEVNYEDLEKDIIRDHKLKLLEKDVTTELVSDYPLHIPNKEDGIFLGDEQYTIEKINHTIDGQYVYLLKDKISIGIWCNADQFFNKHKLKGLATGMIISEYLEANLYCVNATYQEIEDSNIEFAKAVKESLLLDDLKSTKDMIQEKYKVKDKVTEFNQKNIYFYE